MDPSSSSKSKRDSDLFVDEPNNIKPKYDVFLNYASEDIGNNFLSHLKRELDLKSFITSDHTMMPVGQDVGSSKLKAIEESEIFVVVFSLKYAYSVEALDELVKLTDCHREFYERNILPVFFEVEPYDVKNQQGFFEKAFEDHESTVDPERVQTWRQALKYTCRLAGQSFKNGDQTEYLQKIVEELQKMQSPKALYVTTEHPVGLESRRDELIQKLRLDCKDIVLVVAVSGIGGIGKSTIVRETFNIIAEKFKDTCFLADIYEYCRASNWKVELPKVLISCLTRDGKFSIMSNHNDNLSKIKRLVNGKKMLLVLDDIDNFEQLKALGINPSWFGNGSRIIVTTRDKRSLGSIKHVSYVPRLLNRRESLNLFNQFMLARGHTCDTEFVREVVSHAGGIPLVLEVWSNHFNYHQKEEWPCLLETLKRSQHDDVYDKLKRSYDSLSYKAKKLFLDIACFFLYDIFADKDLVMRILEDEETAFFPDLEIRCLLDKGLVEIMGSHLRMHRTIREMGEKIVRQEHEEKPGRRTRLCDKKDVMRVLTTCSGSESVETIVKFSCEDKEATLQVEAFRKMRNLRMISLQLYKASYCLHDEMTPLPFEKLKYMYWTRFPFKSIDNIYMLNVVVLELRHSKLEILWEGVKILKKLKILDVGYSKSLTKTGSFCGLENLEELCFSDCSNLKELDSSIDCLHKLAILNLNKCYALKKVHWKRIVKLPSLRKLRLSDTTGLEPQSLPQMPKLDRLCIYYCDMQSIPNLPRNIESFHAWSCSGLVDCPSNMSELKSLTRVIVFECPKLEVRHLLMKLVGLSNLTHLQMYNCNVSHVPDEIGNLVSLKVLDLSQNPFSFLPGTLSNLLQLSRLMVNSCSQLRSLPLLPSNLTYIGATWCGSLDVMPFDSTQGRYIFRTEACMGSRISKKLEIWTDLQKNIPDWCKGGITTCFNADKRGVVSFVAPMHFDKKICGIIIHAGMTGHYMLKIHNKTKQTSRCLGKFGSWLSRSNHLFYPLDDTTLVLEAGDTMELEFDQKRVPIGCGFRLIYDSDVVDSKLVLQNVDGIQDDTNVGTNIGYYDLDYDDDYNDDDDDDYFW